MIEGCIHAFLIPWQIFLQHITAMGRPPGNEWSTHWIHKASTCTCMKCRKGTEN